MKLIKFIFFLSLPLLLIDCDKDSTGTPNPISPIGSGYHNYNEGILFSWESDEGPFKYNLEVAKDMDFGELLFSDSTIEDLWYVIPIDSFQFNNTYYWRVRASDWRGWGEWSEPVDFTYELGFDLDTTYFPFYLGREWHYECHHYGFDSLDTWDYHDTLVIRVTDSTWESSVLYVSLDMALMLLPNPLKITATGWISISGFTPTAIPLKPFEISTNNYTEGDYLAIYESLNIYYIEDTFAINSSYIEDEWGYETKTDSLFTEFVKGTGTVFQRSCHIETIEDSTVNCNYIDYKLLSEF